MKCKLRPVELHFSFLDELNKTTCAFGLLRYTVVDLQMRGDGGMKVEGRTLGTLALATCVVCISASAVLNKLGMAAGLHPIMINIWRLGFALLIMLPLCFRGGGIWPSLRALSKKEVSLMVLSGAMLAIHFATWAAALYHADAFVAVAIWSTFSLMTVVGSSLLLHERTPYPALLGIVLAICGVAVTAVGAGASRLLGVGMALCAALSQAVYTLCGRVVRRRLDTVPYTMAVYTIAFVCLLGCALAMRLPLGAGASPQGIGAALGLAVLCTLGGHSMQNYALRYYKAPAVSAAILTEVFTGPILVFFVLGEAPTLQGIAGGLLILAGVAWYMIYEWRHTHEAV